MSIVIVSGALANKFRNGGGTWERMSWVKGLMRLGFDVYFIEQIAADACVDAAGVPTEFADSINLEWFRSITQWFGVADRSALVYAGGKACFGLTWERLLNVAESAALLVNLSGHLTLPQLLERIRCKAYIDVDPGFTQFWHADPQISFQLPVHDFYFTVGENIGSRDCSIPTDGIRWRPTRQPVVLQDWPVATAGEPRRFTTIASWRGPFGPVQFNGRTYGLKVHEFRKYLALPRLVRESTNAALAFEIALDIHSSDAKDLLALHDNGWRVTDPRQVVGDPASFRRYIQESDAEFSVAQGIYVETNSGWFSDRTVRYLASGKPVLVQETGFSRNIPVGEGVIMFHTLEEAIRGSQTIAADYRNHCQAARSIAEQYFDSDRVLGQLMDVIGIAS